MACDHHWAEVGRWKEIHLFKWEPTIHVILRCEKCGDLKEFTY